MNCNEYREQFAYWLSGQMTEAEKESFQAHLSTCTNCQAALEKEKHLWQLFDELPVPPLSDNVRSGFYNMLDNYKQKNTATGSWRTIADSINRLWTPRLALRFAYSVCLLLAGLGLGYMLNRPGVENTNQQQIAQLSIQLQEIRQNLSVTLLEHNSAAERMRGVEYAGQMAGANKQVIQALLATLNNDPNVNVRLITLDALIKFADEPAVRIGLVQSIDHQDSPLMQAAIADAMVRLQEKRSVKPLQDLLKKKELNEMVKQRVAQCIQKLI